MWLQFLLQVNIFIFTVAESIVLVHLLRFQSSGSDVQDNLKVKSLHLYTGSERYTDPIWFNCELLKAKLHN